MMDFSFLKRKADGGEVGHVMGKGVQRLSLTSKSNSGLSAKTANKIKAEMPPSAPGIKPLCPATRWTVRTSATDAVLNNY